jgi:hypothetical protein
MKAITAIGFFSAALAASVASAETERERVFQLTQNRSQQMQEILVTIRATTDIGQLSMDADKKTLSVTAAAGPLDMAAWIVKELDQPRQPAGPQIYRPPATSDDVVRIFFLAHPATVQQLQEIATNVRSIVDMRRLFINTTLKAMTVRGTDRQVSMAAWLINQLDQPVGTPSPAPNQYKLPGDDVARVFNLTNPRVPQETQNMVTLIRSVADVQRIFIYNARKTVALRGRAEQIALSEWLITLLDRTAPIAGTNEYKLTTGPDNLVRVFYLPQSQPAQIQKVTAEIRQTARIQRFFPYEPLGAVAVRGTVGQVATAEKLIEEMGQAH